MKINELLEYYLCIKINNPRTAKNYQSIVHLFSNYCHDIPVNNINYLHIKQWKDEILQQASPVTWNTYLRHMKALFKFALKKKIIIDDPFADICFSPVYQKRCKTISHGSIQNIIQIISENPEFYYPNWFWLMVTRFLYLTGIRRRQLVYIQWCDIDFKKKRLTLRGLGSKNRQERDFPLLPSLIDDLHQLQLQHKKTGYYKIDSQVFNITLFNSKYAGNETNENQITGFYKRFAKKTGIQVSPHRFRHTMATNIGNHPNINVSVLSNILGHTNIKVTQQYLKKNLGSQMELLKLLEENLTIKNKHSE